MREILFRGKRIDNGEWVYGSLITNVFMKLYGDVVNRDAVYRDIPYILCPDMADYDCFEDFDEENGIFEVIPETVGEFTGLTDKNSKRIFEGDIIRYADMYDYNCYLERIDDIEAYDNIDFGDIWTVDKVVYGIAISYPAFDLNMHDFEVNGLSELSESGNYYYEVVGNIHDNPELLEGAE